MKLFFRFPSMATYSYCCLTSISRFNPLISSIRIPYTTKTSSLIQYPAIETHHFTVSALVDGQQQQQQQQQYNSTTGNGYNSLQEDSDFRNSFKPFELYVCNLPRNCDITDLLHKFKTHGTVQSVEVSRNAETGISRGCGYVTMSSLSEAKAAIAALDGSDADGREMRVRFSVDMNSKYGSTMSSSRPDKNLVFESPYKLYAGNLAWSVKPEDLRNHFSQFGEVISTTVLHDRKGGKNRVYGFLSFSSSEELEAAMSLDGTQFYGRTLKLREVVKWPEPEP
ncbi:28 kDa ribonucleoprotein, chloroplastic-like [Bidens hawaiensis]|uniref:28 kDa ribonucleoprotein, chloroplastic-like n=1 Tax=Bidens hawaiensis TaxID=980011 RepID=UPI00404B8690